MHKEKIYKIPKKAYRQYSATGFWRRPTERVELEPQTCHRSPGRFSSLQTRTTGTGAESRLAFPNKI